MICYYAVGLADTEGKATLCLSPRFRYYSYFLAIHQADSTQINMRSYHIAAVSPALVCRLPFPRFRQERFSSLITTRSNARYVKLIIIRSSIELRPSRSLRTESTFKPTRAIAAQITLFSDINDRKTTMCLKQGPTRTRFQSSMSLPSTFGRITRSPACASSTPALHDIGVVLNSGGEIMLRVVTFLLVCSVALL